MCCPPRGLPLMLPAVTGSHMLADLGSAAIASASVSTKFTGIGASPLNPRATCAMVHVRLGGSYPTMLWVALCITGNSGCQCPLWAKSGHVRCKRACPLYPRKRHQVRHNGMSALGQKRTYQV